MDGSFVPFVIIGVVLGFLADLVPGIGSPSQVATFATMFIPIDTLGYMATISSISASQTIFSLSTSASIDKTRVGGTALLAGHIAIADNLLLLLALFMAGIAFASVAVYIIRKKAAAFARLDFSMLNIVLALYLIALTILIDGIGGVGILALSTILGVLTVKLGVERTNLMGAIIVPTLLLLFRVFL
jgi:TctA family transporter